MAFFRGSESSIYYEEHGSGFPLLLLAPGGLGSSIPIWDKVAWNPLEELAAGYLVIAMDQRNAGRSFARVTGDETWATYLADQLGLLDHLGIDRFHVFGMCIGGSFIAALAAAAPERVAAAVVAQTIGRENNLETFRAAFDEWVDDIKPAHPEADDETWLRYWHALYSNENRLFSVPDAQLAAIRTPLAVLRGDDVYHPASASRALVDAVPGSVYIEQWKGPEHLPAARARVAEFLRTHTPS